jgi:hypothetical protein
MNKQTVRQLRFVGMTINRGCMLSLDPELTGTVCGTMNLSCVRL